MKNLSFLVLGILTVGLIGISLFNRPSVTLVSADTGAIWTTNGACGSPQNVNHYAFGTHVFINGSDFTVSTQFSWNVSNPGNNGAVLGSGNVTSDASGAFCFDAGTYPSGGPYQAEVGGKNDNFSIDAATTTPTPTPTPTVTPTPTPTPTQCDPEEDEDCVTPTATPTPTPTPTQAPGNPGNPGGPGDGLSDGRSDGRSSCPSCTQAPQGQVLGATTEFASTGVVEDIIMNAVGVIGGLSTAAGIVLKKRFTN